MVEVSAGIATNRGFHGQMLKRFHTMVGLFGKSIGAVEEVGNRLQGWDGPNGRSPDSPKRLQTGASKPNAYTQAPIRSFSQSSSTAARA